MPYIFDANTLLEAKNRYYSFDVCPGFWDWLLQERMRGEVLSIMAVKNELTDPDAQSWSKINSTFFLPNDDSKMAEISVWVMAQPRFVQSAKEKFLSGADPRVISTALANGYTVVTQEVSAPRSKGKVKIPDVCTALKVNCRNTFEVLAELEARFILE